MLKVLFEDNHYIAVLKPAGVLAQGDISGDANLMDEVKKYLKEKYDKPGNVFLGLVHRLDRPVSGIVIFAKTSKGASRLSEQFRNRSVRKSYHAVVTGKLNSSTGELQHYLLKDEELRKAIVFNEAGRGDEATLRYRVISSNEIYTLVKVELETGRFHQIRAQLAHIGHPLAGDVKYGAGEPLKDNSIALCATSLEFQTATTDEYKSLVISYPKEWCDWFEIK